MTGTDPIGGQVPSTTPGPMDDKQYLHRWLRMVRDVMLWKMEGLSDRDIRRPMTRSGTNLLGLVKHITGGEIEYLVATFGRSASGVRLPWWGAENAKKTEETGGDMYAALGESTEYIIDLYRRACAQADRTIDELDLDVIGTVPHDGTKLTLRQALVHMIHETSRHAGHADIVRELIDGAIGGARNIPWVPGPDDDTWWNEYRARVEASAAAAGATGD